MTSTIELQEDFSRLLLPEIAAAERLLELLHQEYALLQQNSPEPLMVLTGQKQQWIEQLESRIARHNEFLRQLELPPDHQGAAAFIDRLPPDAPVRQHWHTLEHVLGDCHKQNEINGSMLAVSQRQVTHALDLLCGVSTGQKTYGRTGESCSNRPSNSLGRA